MSCCRKSVIVRVVAWDALDNGYDDLSSDSSIKREASLVLSSDCDCAPLLPTDTLLQTACHSPILSSDDYSRFDGKYWKSFSTFFLDILTYLK